MNGFSPVSVQEIMANDPAHAPVARAQEWTAGAAYVIDRFVPLGEAAVPITDLGFEPMRSMTSCPSAAASSSALKTIRPGLRAPATA